jgi:hypothetical protein
MSSRWRGLGVRAAACLAATLAGAASSAAQQAGSSLTEDELVRRTEALRPELEEARAAAEAALRRRELEAVARPRPATEIVRVGPLEIVTPPEQSTVVESLVGEVWREHFGGFEASPALASHLFVFQWAWGRVEPLRVDPVETGHIALKRIELTRAWVRTPGIAKERIREALWDVLTRDIPITLPLRKWVGWTGYPSAERVARLVAITPSEANQDCLGGETAGCLVALGLSVGEMSVPPEAPAMLMLEAVRVGGDGAWERLLDRRDADPLDALIAAAGVDADVLLSAWRASLVEARPQVHAGLAAQGGRVLLWLIALAAAAMRSTRWRLA